MREDAPDDAGCFTQLVMPDLVCLAADVLSSKVRGPRDDTYIATQQEVKISCVKGPLGERSTPKKKRENNEYEGQEGCCWKIQR